METNPNRTNETYIDGGGLSSDTTFDRENWRSMIQRIYGDVTRLIDKEGQLIRVEMSEKMNEVKAASTAMIMAGIVLFVGVICIAATAMIFLAQVIPLWLSAVIVTAAFLIIGGVMFAGAKKKLTGDNLRPNKSIAAIGEIRHSLKEKVHEVTKH